MYWNINFQLATSWRARVKGSRVDLFTGKWDVFKNSLLWDICIFYFMLDCQGALIIHLFSFLLNGVNSTLALKGPFFPNLGSWGAFNLIWSGWSASSSTASTHPNSKRSFRAGSIRNFLFSKLSHLINHTPKKEFQRCQGQ
jgi:hypothetical protein